jgi:S-adenosylmethionine-diacylglycerol 3-amino-3-carboxypropyl transferase
MADALPSWVLTAQGLPLAFAQVREDPRIDRFVVERTGEHVRVCMIASGGCTAAVLATMPNVAAIHLVDANPAQLALTRLKLRLLNNTDGPERACILGHSVERPEARRERLASDWSALGLPEDAVGPPELVARLGPDFAGRYERCFAALQQEFSPRQIELEGALALDDPTEQARRVAPDTPLGRELNEALDTVMSLPNLVALFGEGATRNPVEPFSRHFARRIRHAFATLPAATNPFLWQMLRGLGQPDWLALATLPIARPGASVCDVTWRQAFMADALREHREAFDVVHLSNILDWLSPEEATATLTVAAQALRAGGQVIIRQLNSTLDIPASGPMFEWDEAAVKELHARDRSFFYRALHLGRKR